LIFWFFCIKAKERNLKRTRCFAPQAPLCMTAPIGMLLLTHNDRLIS
jgi:hypothetical protein